MNTQISIEKRLGLSNFSSNTIEQIRDYVLNREADSIRLLERFNNAPLFEFALDPHALERWNTRVGPIFEDIEQLERTISFLHGFRRIKLYDKKNLGSIDDDILFTFKREDGKVVITTFYGRISLVNYLSNFDVLRKYNLKNNDGIKLEQPVEVLNEQLMIIHKEIMVFNGSHNRYLLEIFDNEGQDMIYLTVLRGYNANKTIEINPNEVNLSTRLSKSCLAILADIGYSEFVDNYQNELRNIRRVDIFKQSENAFVGA
ncbi:hypothetical protein D3C87_574350 [compost metagenome]